MSTIVEHHTSGERGLGPAGVIAIIVLALLIALFFFRGFGRPAAPAASGPSVNVSGSLQGGAE